MVIDTESLSDIIPTLEAGGIGVIRTDTLYGIVAKASDERAVERIYQVKGRTPSKPPIILIASTSQLLNQYDDAVLEQVAQFWPGKNSVILPVPNAPDWLVRKGDSLAYRIPDNAALRDLIARTGPLIAPSANPEGRPPARTIDEAKDYFGDAIDFYVDHGAVTDDTPSRLFRLREGTFERLR